MLNDGAVKSQSELYQCWVELQEKLMSQNSMPQLVFSLNELDCDITREWFLTTKHLFSQGVDFIVNMQIEQKMWQTIKQQVEIQRRIKSVTPDIVSEIVLFYKQRIEFITTLIKIVKDLHPNLGQINKENRARLLLSNLCCYLGELNQALGTSLQQHTQAALEYLRKADAIYYKTIQYYPFCGKYYYLIATIMAKFGDIFASTHNLLKALMNQASYDCKESLNEAFEKGRSTFNDWARELRPSGQHNRDTLRRAFLLYFLRLTAIVFTKIGFNSLHELQPMFEFLQEYLKIVKTNVQDDHQTQMQLLLEVLIMTNFSLYHCTSGERQIKKPGDIRENDMAKEYIKFVYGIYVNVLDFVLKYSLENSSRNIDQIAPQIYLQLVIPIIYYLTEQPIVCAYLLKQYPQLNDKLAQIYLLARQNLSRAEHNEAEDLFQLQDNIQEEFKNNIFPFEMPLLGFTCYSHAFQRLKQDFREAKADENFTTITLFYVCEQLIRELHGIDLSTPMLQLNSKVEQSRQWEDSVKNELVKPLIVIDGMNVAIRYGQETISEARFITQGLKLALEYWMKRGHSVIIILPDYCFKESEVQKKKQENRYANKIPDDIKLLNEFKSKQLAYGIPNWNYDDSYMIKYARDKQGLIMTNDRYNDHIRSLDSNVAERERLKEWIRNNCISYTFIQNELMPDPDFMKKLESSAPPRPRLD